jgi:sulfatase maturation enzyme AslB (radical SAM superfamily)
LDSSVEIRFNTNGTIINPNVYEELKRFETVNMCFSVDGIGRVNDYIRWSSDWKTIETNMLRWAEFVKYKSLGPTLQVMNILDYDNVVEWARKHDFEVFDNMLYNPPYFNLQNAPDELKAQAQHFKEWIDKPADEQHQENFRKVVKTFDYIRKCDIKDYIPEVARIYGL